jgi:hypothetical protein
MNTSSLYVHGLQVVPEVPEIEGRIRFGQPMHVEAHLVRKDFPRDFR